MRVRADRHLPQLLDESQVPSERVPVAAALPEREPHAERAADRPIDRAADRVADAERTALLPPEQTEPRKPLHRERERAVPILMEELAVYVGEDLLLDAAPNERSEAEEPKDAREWRPLCDELFHVGAHLGRATRGEHRLLAL